ncbi:MAG: macrolide ABC transporter ATP-binding protein [Myxococcales bacterium]|nr:macrolide ABC transporter ATP-binding protein [Myxococcales bacterium]
MIQARDLSKEYREGGRTVTALHSLDLDIGEKDYLAIMGPSGSGKTTVLNLLGALDTDYGGSLRFNDSEVKSMKRNELAGFRNQTVGFVYQSFHLLPHLSVLQNVALPAHFARNGSPDRKELTKRANHLLLRVGLDGMQQRKPLHLSGGERQRVAIARALFNQPRMILCDEPTGALDDATGDSILGLFEELNEQLGVTIVLVTHDQVVADRAHSILRLRDGRLDSAPEEES